MRSSLIAVLGAANAAMAASFTNSSMPMSTGAPGSDDKAFPSSVGDFDFLGCFSGSLPTFKSQAKNDKMTLDLCAASCPGEFFGVVATECLCADSLDQSKAKKEEKSRCSTKCPGMPEQHCGGPAMSKKKRDIPEGTAASVYKRRAGTGVKTVTSTTTGTITSCAPTVTNCPVGKKTHGVITKTVAICPAPKWHASKIICCGDHCAPEYPCEGAHCVNHRVICDEHGNNCRTEECTTEEWHKLVICKGNDCHYSQCKGAECDRKIVCYNGVCVREECYANECHNDIVCKGDKCGWEACKPGPGVDCKKNVICDEHGQNCKPVVPGPKPQPAPAPKPAPLPTPKPAPGPAPKPAPGPGPAPKPAPGPVNPVKPTHMPVVEGGVAKTGISLVAAAAGLLVLA